jgi:drug/metabolite transporter (DMT)-like permease
MSSLKRLGLILALTSLWSPSFLFIKLALHDLPPMTIVTLRVGLATLVFLLILLWRKQALPKHAGFWLHAAVMAILSSALPFCLFCYAEQTIDSALAAILNGCAPMFTAILAHMFLPSDRMTPQKMVGVLCSILGLIALFLPSLLNGFSGNLAGCAAGAGAALCYASSHIYGKKYLTGLPPFVAPTAQLAVSTLLLFPLALLFEAPFQLPPPSLISWAGVCGLSLFGTILAFTVYYKLMEECGPTAISMVACFFPVGGIVLGYLLLGESLTFHSLIAGSFILLGMMIVNQVISLKQLIPILSKTNESAT